MPHIPTPPDHLNLPLGQWGQVIGGFSNPQMMEVVHRCEAKYRHWHKVRYIARASDLDPVLLWAMIKFARGTRRRDLPFTDRDGQHMTYTVPDWLQEELMMIDRQLAGQITFDDQSQVTNQQRDRFIISALMEEAIASSQLEGASTTHRVAKEMLRQNRPPRDRSEQMIVNNYRAIMFIREQRHTPLSPELLIDLQQILTAKTLDRPDECGRLRHEGEHVVVEDPYGEVLHTPPPASTLPGRLKALCAFANETTEGESTFIHPVIRAMTLHFQLAYDHPFCDGNGRTARVLFYWYMLRTGYWMFEFLPISKLIYRSPSKYSLAFQYVETDEFDLTYFLMYHARVIRLARRELQQYLARKRHETQTARLAFRSLKVNDRQRMVLLDALEQPSREFTIEEHRAKQRVSYHTARADMLGLEELGYLNRRRLGKRFLFVATERVQQDAAVR